MQKLNLKHESNRANVSDVEKTPTPKVKYVPTGIQSVIIAASMVISLRCVANLKSKGQLTIPDR